MSKVSIAKGEHPYQRTISALNMIGDDLRVPVDAKILIKFNCAPYFQYLPSAEVNPCEVSVNPIVIKAVADFLLKRGAKNIIIGEGPVATETNTGFKECGYVDLCEQLGCELVDLDNDEMVSVDIPNALSLTEIPLAKTAVESDFIVSVAVMRTHGHSIVSLCMKNLMGCIPLSPNKQKMHPRSNRALFSERLVDLTSVLKPSLCVIDTSGCIHGSVREKGPVKLDLAIASTDVVAIDSVGATVMSVPWYWLTWLTLAEKQGLGTANLSNIEVVGEEINEVKYPFELER